MIFAAMAAFLIAALCVPEAFGDLGARVRPRLRRRSRRADRPLPARQPRRPELPPLGARASRSSTAIGVALLIARLVPRRRAPRARSGSLALVARHGRALPVRLRGLEAGARPLRRAPRPDRDHRPRRVDRRDRRRRRVASHLGHRRRGGARDRRWRRRSGGPTSTSSRWSPPAGWSRAPEGQVRNELARDSYSYIHFLMVAGIILVALGLKKTLGHVDDPLDDVPAFALLGGVAIYLLGLVAFRYRHIHTINRQRLGIALAAVRALPGRDGAPGARRCSSCSPCCSGRDRLRDPRLRRGPRPRSATATRPPRSRLARPARQRDRADAGSRVPPMPQLPLGDGRGRRRRDLALVIVIAAALGGGDRAGALAAAGDPGRRPRARARDRHRPAGLRHRAASTPPPRSSATSGWACSSSSPATRSTSSGSRAGRWSSGVLGWGLSLALAYGIGGALAAAGVVLSYLYTGLGDGDDGDRDADPDPQRRRRDANHASAPTCSAPGRSASSARSCW